MQGYLKNVLVGLLKFNGPTMFKEPLANHRFIKRFVIAHTTHIYSIKVNIIDN